MALGGMGLLVMACMFVPIALILMSFLGVWAIKGSPVLAAKMLGLAANDAIASYFFGVVPLFVLMGFLVSESGIGRDAFDVANAAFRKIKGGLGVGTVAANAIFAAVTGISIASAAVFTKIAVPEMRRHGYTSRFSESVPLTALIVIVLGGIYAGFFTPVEAGAVGAIGALVIGLLKRRLDAAALWRVLVETGLVTAAVCFLIIAAQMYSRMLAFSGVPNAFGDIAATADLGMLGIIMLYCAVVIALGMILDSSSIMLILVPLMLPIVTPMGVDLIWFGIVTVVAIEIGLLTPPFGISVYVIKSTLNDPDISLSDIFIGAAPFAVMMLICLGLIIAFPVIATGLL